MPVAEIILKQFGSFLFVDINKEYKIDLPFIQTFMRITVDYQYNMLENLQLNFAEDLPFLRNSIADF